MTGRDTTLASVVTGGVFDVPSDAAVARARAAREKDARERAAEIEPAVESLADCGAVSRRRWRLIAHALHARHVYTAHIEPFTGDLTYSEIAARLNRIGIPRFRRGAPWCAQSIAETRKIVQGLRNGEILLPDS